MKKRELEVVIYQDDDGYIAQCLNVNVASDGDTSEEALVNIKEALELYFEDEPNPDVVSVNHVQSEQNFKKR